MADAREPVLRDATFADCEAVLALKRGVGLGSDSAENWQRLWGSNPALSAAEPKPSMGWVLDLDGRIVGYLGNIVLRYRYGDRTLVAATANGFAVHPSFRSYSLSVAARYFHQEHVDLLLNTTANEAGSQIFRLFKACPVPQTDYDQLLFWVLRPGAFLCSALRKRELPAALAWAGGMAGAAPLWLENALLGRRPCRVRKGLALSAIGVEEIGAEFDQLWQRVSFAQSNSLPEGKVKARLLGYRGAETLRWHFQLAAERRQTTVLCCHRGGRLAGYALLERRDSPEIGLRRTRIADLLAEDDDPLIIDALLWAAHRHARGGGSHVLEMIGFPHAVRARFLARRPYRRKLDAWPYYYKATDRALAAELEDVRAWYACPYDGDASL